MRCELVLRFKVVGGVRVDAGKVRLDATITCHVIDGLIQ